MNIGERIKARRNEIGLTLKEVAEKLGVKDATVQRYESGSIKNMKYETIASLAEILNVPPSWLLGWDDDKPTDNNNCTNSEEETKLLLMFRNLNEDGKDAALEYIKYLTTLAKYKKCDCSEKLA
jgi:transcriptional regulator with XRE-family HTH domain